MIRVGIMTVSSRCAWDEEEDHAGPAVESYLPPDTYSVFLRVVCPDEEGEIAMQLVAMSEAGCDLILTAGGIGFSPHNVTPEATVSILDKNAPGISEKLRADAVDRVRDAALGRGVAGIHGRTLIVNLPDTEQGIGDAMRSLLPLLPTAVAQVRGDTALSFGA